MLWCFWIEVTLNYLHWCKKKTKLHLQYITLINTQKQKQKTTALIHTQKTTLHLEYTYTHTQKNLDLHIICILAINNRISFSVGLWHTFSGHYYKYILFF